MKLAGATILVMCTAAFAADVVIPLKLDSGGILLPTRDTRTFAVPVSVNGKDYTFAWGCAGWTIVSEKFAREAELKLAKPNEELASWVDAQGQPLFAGVSDAQVTFAGQTMKVELKVLKDAYTDGKTLGTIGYDVASKFQWELNPDPEKPTLTLRPPGTKIDAKPLATLPLTDDGQRLWLPVTVRNVAFDLVIMPQASDIVAGPSIQKKWDLTKGKLEEIPSPAGPVRTATLTEREPVDLGKKVTEKHVTILLVGDPESGEDMPANTNAVGASMLNRFHYVVDQKTRQLTLLSKKQAPATQPAP